MLAVVTLRPNEPGRHYRLPTERDYAAVRKAQEWLAALLAEWELGGKQGVCPVPDELINPIRPSPNARGLSAVTRFGMERFGDVFTARQKVALVTLTRAVQGLDRTEFCEVLALALSKLAELACSVCAWEPLAECPRHIFGRQAIPIAWDFGEGVLSSSSSGSFVVSLENVGAALDSLGLLTGASSPQLADAAEHPLPDETAAVWFTDPPYYDAIPYADLSDFFLVWLKRVLPTDPLLRDPFDTSNALSPKERESVWNRAYSYQGRPKDNAFYEGAMARAFAEGRRVLSQDGIGSVVFAHKTTEGWEALLSGMIRGGWTITGSWPIATEMGSRLNARETASLSTSVHLICRPRPDDAPVGDWAAVLRELPSRVGDWMERLQGEGVRGADLVFACIGPALEIYSRYAKVVDAEDRQIPLGGDPTAADPHKRGYLAYVWETVGRSALQQILGQDEGAAGLEEDARLVALFLWTLQSTNGVTNREEAANEAEEDEAPNDDEDEESSGRKPKGYTLIYDVARRFAQPLGIHMDDWEGRIIGTKKGVVRLLPVAERAKQLFGEDGAQAAADRIEREPASAQLSFFPEVQAESGPRRGGRKVTITASDESISQNRSLTTLDRVHVAMLLQSSGRANALRALLAAEQERGAEFLRLANALSALYPRESEEKRLLDAMLLAVPR